MSSVTVNFHWRDKAIGDEMPSQAKLRKEREHFVVSLGEGLDSAVVSLFFSSASSAYAFASTIMSGAEHLERIEQEAQGDRERPWVDVPLPLADAGDREVAGGVSADSAGQLGVAAADDSASCLHGRLDECAELGCADEECARF